MRRSFAGKVLNNSTFGNYYNLAHSGSSATFTKYLASKSRVAPQLHRASASDIREFKTVATPFYFLVEGEDLNSTYAVNMELIPGGLLKESSLDFNLETADETLNLISVSSTLTGH